MTDPTTTATPVPPGNPAMPLPREAVGIFSNDVTMTAAIDDLLLNGFARCQVGLLANTETASASTHLARPLEELMDDSETKRASWFCPEAMGDAEGGLISGFTIIPMLGTAWAATAVGGTLVATTALTLGTGGLGLAAGGVLAWWLHHRNSTHIRHQVDAGGLLLWIRTVTPELEERAMEILRRNGGTHVHVHGDTASLPV